MDSDIPWRVVLVSWAQVFIVGIVSTAIVVIVVICVYAYLARAREQRDAKVEAEEIQAIAEVATEFIRETGQTLRAGIRYREKMIEREEAQKVLALEGNRQKARASPVSCMVMVLF